MTGVIRTIGGDLPAELAGPTYTHEHLVIDSPLVAETMPHIHLGSIDEGCAEVETCVVAGVRTMVDAMPAGSGRDPDKLARISILTGMRVVAATGLHTERYYRDLPWAGAEDPEVLAQRFVADIEDGIDLFDYRGEKVDRTAILAGVVKVATMGVQLNDRDRRLFAAAAITSQKTGVPILTHTEGGMGGLAQIEELLGLGISPDRIALSHTDKVADAGYHRAMLETSAYLCYDQGIREPEQTFELVGSMVESGFADQLLLGTDGARRTLWKTLGGEPGLASLIGVARERLTSPLVDQIFVVNPARWLSLASS
ncbi:MAG TPA: aryldialkylphosphatase [Acidimicrobiia bacterium]|nr:aryldialkylphosphatase [Acidimicrobiia bacterium]